MTTITTKQEAINAVKQDYNALEVVPHEFTNDRDVVLAAVNQHGEALKFASNALKNDREMIMAAIASDACGALSCLSDKWLNDREIGMAAIQHQYYSFQLLGSELRNDPHFVLDAILIDKWTLQWASEELQHKFAGFNDNNEY